jgi:hypothetical protein
MHRSVRLLAERLRGGFLAMACRSPLERFGCKPSVSCSCAGSDTPREEISELMMLDYAIYAER